MKVRALISFSGSMTMAKGEITECSDKAILNDLLKARYIEKVADTPKGSVNKDGNKRDKV